MRHRAFNGIDQQNYTINHAQHALNFSAEVGVSRRIDDVDVDAVVLDRGVLGKNRDTTLFFQIIGVHDALDQLLVSGESAGLAEQLVNQCGFTVVNVGDDGDIADRASRHGMGNSLKNQRRDSTTPCCAAASF